MNEKDARTRAETVGSLLRSPLVQQAVVSDDPDDVAVLDAAVLDAIQMQDGLDVITDGETRRRSWTETPHYLDCFDSVAHGGALNWRGGAGGAETPPAGVTDVVTSRLSTADRRGDRLAQYRFLTEHSDVRTKFTLAAPSYHRRYWSDEHSSGAYGSVDEFLFEVRDYLREVVEGLIQLGCDYIQCDAPNYGSLCDSDHRADLRQQGHDVDAEMAFDAALDNSLFDGITGVTRALHICRGNAAGGRWHSQGGYGAISGSLFAQLDFDRLMLEYDTERAGTFDPLADIKPGTVAVLGLLTTKVGNLEDESLVRERVAEAADIKPLGELALSTQCGFASVAAGNPLTPDQQRAKLALIGRLAHDIWLPAGA